MLMSFKTHDRDVTMDRDEMGALLEAFSIEVMPRTAAKVDRFAEILPAGTQIYLAHIDGTPLDDMVATARRLAEEGFPVMPHFPARLFESEAQLRDLISRYQQEAGVTRALLLGGGVKECRGPFDSALALLETGAFDNRGFSHLYFAGHPEGNRDIDPDGGRRTQDAALKAKLAYVQSRGIETALVTQFVFAAQPVRDWIGSLRQQGIDAPVHVGIAGPTKLHALIKMSIVCGVGASLSVLRKRAKDLSSLVRPFEPTDLLSEFVQARAAGADNLPDRIHIFPLGGVGAAASYLSKQTCGQNPR